MKIIEAHNVVKTFAEGRESVQVLRGVSLSVEQGEIVALEGPSGSGKTTLLSILGCILTPSSGEIIVDGQRVLRDESVLPKIRRKSIGFVFQQFNLFGALTAQENVEYALNLKGKKGREARIEADELLDAVGLSERKKFLPRDLSGGQKQRVAIARALAGKAPLLLADEPTANIDTPTATQILELFRKLAKEQNRTLLIVTHDPKVRAITDRVLHIRDGLILENP
jgi:putative ABC transport system ATP-binding protein